MFDGALRPVIDPPLRAMGRQLARAGVGADAVTLAGLLFGLGAATLVALGQFGPALAMLALGRLCDGLDGAVAAATRRTDRGGFLDIVCDFVFYGAVPLAFAIHDPAAHALAACVLLFTFYVNGASFLAYAAVAAKRGLETRSRGEKSLFFTAGLAEGAETIAAFAAMMLWPAHFSVIAYAFAAVVAVTAVSRMILAWTTFDDGRS
jgi:phosphatidylglycerophosphate synthase